MRVLVCGGRDYSDFETIVAVLNDIHGKAPISLIIHGDARGADRLAGSWAAYAGVEVKRYPADWVAHGRGAGHIRNRHMLVDGKPDLVVAFPGGPGTANMVIRTLTAKVPVMRVTDRHHREMIPADAVIFGTVFPTKERDL